MNVDNVWYNRQSPVLEEAVISHFKSIGRWGTVIWNDNEYLHPDVSPEAKGEYYNHKYVEVPHSIYNNVYKNLSVFIDMQSRRSPWSSRIPDQKNFHDHLNIFNKMLNITYKKLVENNISLIVMNRALHFGGDLLLYLLAKELKIKTLFLEQSAFPNLFFHYFDHYDYGNFDTSYKLREHEIEPIPNTFKKDIWYMKSLEKKPPLKKRLRAFFDDEIKLVKESFTYKGWEQSLQRYANRKRYVRNLKAAKSLNVDLNVPFVYFPLHLQPEKSTSSWGGIYCDQLLAIEQLSAKLPKGWFIYVKENPKQGFMMRGEWFFDRLNSIPNAKLVDANTYDLLSHSQFAATITGTVGWEAITGGKNAVVFGWGTWYKKLPGVFSFDENFSVEKIMSYKINHQELEAEVAKLKGKMCLGVAYPFYRRNFPGYDHHGNIKQVIESLNQILYKTESIG